MMDIQEVSQALSNPTRLNLIRIVGAGSCSAAEAHRKYVEEYDGKKRESIYRELENLVEASLLTKEYINEKKEIQYRLVHQQIRIDLGEISLEPIEN